MHGNWVATYRLQVHAGFPLDSVGKILPYLAELGISHVYLSPCLQAAPGSQHGYDVADPSRISEDLGGEEAWSRIVEGTRAHGLKILLDIVPNHMSASHYNPWWDGVLTDGPFSPYANFFDIKIPAAQPFRVHICSLARAYGDALLAGELMLELKDGMPRVKHYDNSWPVGPASWGPLLAGTQAGRDGCWAELEGMLDRPQASAAERERYQELAERGRGLLRGAVESGALAGAIAEINRSHDRIDAVLQRQFFVLHGWKLAGELTNYRRFFDVGALSGIRTELPEVFDASHARIRTMVERGELDGLRIDHPDGLLHPMVYFERLRELMPEGRVYVEKILENDEKLVEHWPIQGTVGYDFLAKVNRLWMDDQRVDALTATYSDFTGHTVNFAALVRDMKRQIVESTFSADLERLALAALNSARSHWQSRDVSPRQLREALARVTVALSVYRTYRTADTLADEDRRVLTDAVQSARIGAPEIDAVAFDYLLALITKPELDRLETSFVEQWQQLAPAVMAKGVEDTTFYSYDRLVSCNEVGAQASLIGISADKFHEFCHYLSEQWPNNMLATSTHDNKRSEDVRTRISVLSEIPDRWSEALHAWSQMNAPAWKNRTPDRHAEYLLYQTLIGAWPISEERCWQYMQKALREAKIRTSWHEPNAGYEENIRGFVGGVFETPKFTASLQAFVEPLILPGRINSLAQTLIKMVVAGVPDFYQGTELWDLSLVDPDNRRPVDFELRREMSARCKDLSAADVLAEWDSGLPKLWLVASVLALRRERTEDFSDASKYQPLVAQGAHLGNVLAFRRGENLIVVVPRFTLSVAGDWGDTQLSLPPGAWKNHFTGAEVQGSIGPAQLWEGFPVALLTRSD